MGRAQSFTATVRVPLATVACAATPQRRRRDARCMLMAAALLWPIACGAAENSSGASQTQPQTEAGAAPQPQKPEAGYRVYEWRAPDGSTVFSDEPRAGARERRIDEPMTVPPAVVTGRRATAASQEREDTARGGYRAVSVATPQPDDVFWVNPEVPVRVRVDTQPVLRPGHRIVLDIDGARLPDQTGPAFEVWGLERGSHAVRALVLDQQGEVMARSDAVTFHVKRPAVGGN